MPKHVLLCQVGSAQSDQMLRQAADLCEASGALISVVLPVVDGPLPKGCCGVQGDHWLRLMNEAMQDGLVGAVAQLAAFGCRPEDAAVEAGPSVTQIVYQAASRRGCDVVAVGRKRRPWSAGGLSRRQLNKLRRGTTLDVVELRG